MARLIHEGKPRRSGRYPWGSGENPRYLLELRARMNALRRNNPDIEDAQLAKTLNLSLSKVAAASNFSVREVNNFYRKNLGLKETEVAEALGINTKELRAQISIEKAKDYASKVSLATKLYETDKNVSSIARKMGLNESTVRNLLDPAKTERASITTATADMLKKQVDAKKYLDIGAGVEHQIGISRNRLGLAIEQLKQEGYKIQYLQTTQMGTGKKTSIKVLTKEDVSYSEVSQNRHLIRTVTDWTDDYGRSWKSVQPPTSLDSKRIMVRFSDDPNLSGSDMDGTIQLRRGVRDLSLGENRYAQVRIAVDGQYYMKGMAIYADDMPPGIDVIYNTNKPSSVGKLGAMKKMNTIVSQEGGDIYIDKAGNQKINEFGATIRQKTYIDTDGSEKLSALNIVGFVGKDGSGEEGSWSTWSKTLSSQFLSKQPVALAKKQLNMSYDIQKTQFDTILEYTNPAIRARLLDSFADDCDSKAVQLKAAALPRQESKVILPLPNLKESEVYAPTYKNGDKIILVRYPHAGTFEIPVVTVNNKSKDGISILGNASDAIGIHPKTASRLSGADFDGDTVLTIPYTTSIKTTEPLEGLKNFDPISAYPKYPGMKTITNRTMQDEMGKVSNLITDMTLQDPSPEELTRAVRHSMVVIDSYKHELDWKRSYEDNGIAELKVKYQGGTLSRPKGASTLISRASSEIRVPARRPVIKEDLKLYPELEGSVRRGEYSVNPRTGKKVWVPTGEGHYVDPSTGRKVYVNPSRKNQSGVEYDADGKLILPDGAKFVPRLIKSTKMYEVDDALTLSTSLTTMEKIYGEYANNMKALGDRARLESINIKPQERSPSAAKTYAVEVERLNSALAIAKSNAPLERQALLLANYVVDTKKKANPNMTAADAKKVRGQAIEDARITVGANKKRIVISEREWEAINAGAITHSKLIQILNNADLDQIKELATPSIEKILTPAMIERIKSLVNKKDGYTQAEVAEHLGISISTVEQALRPR